MLRWHIGARLTLALGSRDASNPVQANLFLSRDSERARVKRSRNSKKGNSPQTAKSAGREREYRARSSFASLGNSALSIRTGVSTTGARYRKKNTCFCTVRNILPIFMLFYPEVPGLLRYSGAQRNSRTHLKYCKRPSAHWCKREILLAGDSACIRHSTPFVALLVCLAFSPFTVLLRVCASFSNCVHAAVYRLPLRSRSC